MLSLLYRHNKTQVTGEAIMLMILPLRSVLELLMLLLLLKDLRL
jgi:hypothetical protein